MSNKLETLAINCEWETFNKDISNSWSGHLVIDKTNHHSFIGIVTDTDKKNSNLPYTHFVIGSIEEGKGLVLFKVDMFETQYDLINFEAFKNDKTKSYDGEFSAFTFIGPCTLGTTNFTIEQENLSDLEIQDILQKSENCKQEILNRPNSDLNKIYVEAILNDKEPEKTIQLIESRYEKSKNEKMVNPIKKTCYKSEEVEKSYTDEEFIEDFINAHKYNSAEDYFRDQSDVDNSEQTTEDSEYNFETFDLDNSENFPF